MNKFFSQSDQPVMIVPNGQYAPSGMPMMQQVPVAPKPEKVNTGSNGLVKNIIIALLAVAMVIFAGLFVWKAIESSTVDNDVDEQISIAVNKAVEDSRVKQEEEFMEREKEPFKTFSGPIDYGQLTFRYPKTWSVYISNTASDGGDFHAFLNPGQVEADNNGETIYALRVSIVNDSFDNVAKSYNDFVESKDSELSVKTENVNNNTSVGNLYTGLIPRTEFKGSILIFKIRDKTAILQTDSELFKEDFDKIVKSITFNA